VRLAAKRFRVLLLWLITGNAKAAANLRLEAEKRGVVPERLIFAPKASIADHLARHRLADLCLDTLPYNAHTTASDALWSGLPVLTCLGESFAGRVAASLLKAIGLDALITSTLAEYEALALRLARDPAYLATLKERLVRNRDESPLFDTQRATRHIETAYQTMAGIARRNERPRSFNVG
jgi:protein O-GlcNAc transferase